MYQVYLLYHCHGDTKLQMSEAIRCHSLTGISRVVTPKSIQEMDDTTQMRNPLHPPDLTSN